MLYYPQLSTGALVQLPFRRSLRLPAITNAMLSGEVIQAADPDANAIDWRLDYAGLTDNEQTALRDFFVAAEGRLRSFVFIDPADNLLRWSEDLLKDSWRRDPMLQVAALDGGVFRIVNAGQTAQGIEQTVNAPAWYQYAFSTYVRASGASPVWLRLSGQLSSETMAGSQWQRAFCSGSLEGVGESFTCRLEIPAGAVVEVRGLQLDAQPMPGEYRRTTSRHGVYSNTRFAEDRISFTSNGIDDHATTIRLISRAGA